MLILRSILGLETPLNAHFILPWRFNIYGWILFFSKTSHTK